MSKRLANICISPSDESENENESESDNDNGSREREAPIVDNLWKDECYDLVVATGELNLYGGAFVKFSGPKKCKSGSMKREVVRCNG